MSPVLKTNIVLAFGKNVSRKFCEKWFQKNYEQNSLRKGD